MYAIDAGQMAKLKSCIKRLAELDDLPSVRIL